MKELISVIMENFNKFKLYASQSVLLGTIFRIIRSIGAFINIVFKILFIISVLYLIPNIYNNELLISSNIPILNQLLGPWLEFQLFGIDLGFFIKHTFLTTLVGLTTYSIFTNQLKPIVKIISNFVAAGSIFLVIKLAELELYGKETLQWKLIKISKVVPIDIKMNIYKDIFMDRLKVLFGEIKFAEIEDKVSKLLLELDLSKLKNYDRQDIVLKAKQDAKLIYHQIMESTNSRKAISEILTSVFENTKVFIYDHWGKILTVTVLTVILISLYTYINYKFDEAITTTKSQCEDRFSILRLADSLISKRTKDLETKTQMTSTALEKYKATITENLVTIKNYINDTIVTNLKSLENQVNTLKNGFITIARAH